MLESTAERLCNHNVRQGEQEAETNGTSEDAKRRASRTKKYGALPHAICCATAPPLHSPVAYIPTSCSACCDPGDARARAVSVIDAPAASAYSPLDALRDDLASGEVEALRTVYRRAPGRDCRDGRRGRRAKSKLATHAHAVTTKHGWARREGGH